MIEPLEVLLSPQESQQFSELVVGNVITFRGEEYVLVSMSSEPPRWEPLKELNGI